MAGAEVEVEWGWVILGVIVAQLLVIVWLRAEVLAARARASATDAASWQLRQSLVGEQSDFRDALRAELRGAQRRIELLEGQVARLAAERVALVERFDRERDQLVDYFEGEYAALLRHVDLLRDEVQRRDPNAALPALPGRKPRPARQSTAAMGKMGREAAARLVDALGERLDMEELRNLAFEMGMDYAPHNSQMALARALVEHAEKLRRVEDLVGRVRVMRPDIQL